MLRIFWFRKDLRIEDNYGLRKFLDGINNRENDEFLFLYIKNKNSFNFFGEKRIKFLFQCLVELEQELKERSLNLRIIEGKSKGTFKKILKQAGKISVYANEQPEPYSRKRDEEVKQLIENAGGKFKLYTDSTIFKLGKILKNDGKPYVVYTPFKNAYYRLIQKSDYENRKYDFRKLNAKNEYNLRDFRLINPDEECKKYSETSIFAGSRKAGLNSLKSFANNVLTQYKSRRDFPSDKGTSLLSPHLHFGTIGIREAFRTAFEKIDGLEDSDLRYQVETWMNELIWREFYYNISFHFPRIESSSFKEEYDNLKWNESEKDFEAWCNGSTGYPIVDAGMRQLRKEGWMHNRVRMITAMFLTKDLLVDWRKGERFFADNLIDFDFSSNNGGWQWSSSTGVDAAPYFRIFNPALQGRKFDKKGDYIKKYIPELTLLPEKHIHSPWEMNEDEQRQYGVKLGKNYPNPVVNHKEAREIVIREYKKIS